MPESLSIIIKTFERPASLRNLLQSIRDQKLTYPILIADDSKVSSGAIIKKEFSDLSITYIDLPFDTGLSEGRNVLVNRVSTDFFLLCDDDYVFEERTDLKRAYYEICTNTLDLLGGEYYNYVNIPNLKVFVRQLTHPLRLKRFFLNQYKRSAYIGNFTIKGKDCELTVSYDPPSENISTCDLVNNFFIARVSAVKDMGGWDKELKMGEHEDFFLRAKQHGLKVAFLANFGTGHYPAIPIKNSAYNQYRVRAAHFKQLFVKKYDFNNYIEKEKNSGKILFVHSKTH
ncbi:MAG: glycosyltransferase [bacterium]|nr:glycosyltransferase [bacterium]